MMAESALRFLLLLLPVARATCRQLVGTALCQPGNFIDGEGKCCQCPQGKFSATVGQADACLECPAGTFADVVGSKTCLLCPPGTYSGTGAKLCTVVPDLRSQALGFGNTASSPCPDEFITVQGTCVPCSPGTIPNIAANKCAFCDASVTLDANLYLATGEDGCLKCDFGTVPSPKLDKCVRAPCPLGKMLGDGEDTGICVDCPDCSTCIAGRWGAKAPSPTCKACPLGKFLPWNGAADESFCLPCHEGYYNDNDQGAIQCKPCVAGKYSATPEGTSENVCLSCDPGTFNPLAGQKKCIQCPPGTISSPDKVRCVACAPGKFSASGETECKSAEAGTMAPRPGMANTIDCPPGYSSAAGASQCTICRVGTYADAPKTVSPCATCSGSTFVGATACATA